MTYPCADMEHSYIRVYIYIFVYMHYVHQYMSTSTTTSYVNKPFTACMCVFIYTCMATYGNISVYIYTWTFLYIHIPKYPDTYVSSYP